MSMREKCTARTCYTDTGQGKHDWHTDSLKCFSVLLKSELHASIHEIDLITSVPGDKNGFIGYKSERI